MEAEMVRSPLVHEGSTLPAQLCCAAVGRRSERSELRSSGERSENGRRPEAVMAQRRRSDRPPGCIRSHESPSTPRLRGVFAAREPQASGCSGGGACPNHRPLPSRCPTRCEQQSVLARGRGRPRGRSPSGCGRGGAFGERRSELLSTNVDKNPCAYALRALMFSHHGWRTRRAQSRFDTS